MAPYEGAAHGRQSIARHFASFDSLPGNAQRALWDSAHFPGFIEMPDRILFCPAAVRAESARRSVPYRRG